MRKRSWLFWVLVMSVLLAALPFDTAWAAPAAQGGNLINSPGFEGAFAQPLRVVSKCLQHLPTNHSEIPVQLKLFYKGPVYYNHMLTMLHSSQEKSLRFDLYSEDDDRPCISGNYQAGVSI